MPRNNRSSRKQQAPKPWRSPRRSRRPRQLTVRSELRQRPDTARIARAIIELVASQAQHEAEASASDSASTSGEGQS
ncbi:Uncharacterised protein [Actinomyces denticolens]|nr:Uncharacterised protein [Actinomyces denticolens]